MITHRAAATRAPKTAVADMGPVDLIVCGTVAVNRQGVRLGKGAGYSPTYGGDTTERLVTQ